MDVNSFVKSKNNLSEVIINVLESVRAKQIEKYQKNI